MPDQGSFNLRRTLAAALGVLAAVYAVAYADLWLRGRAACLEGEKYMEWSRRPELKAVELDRVFARQEARLQEDYLAGRLTSSQLRQRLALARFKMGESLKESSLKYACVWFKTAAELFSPPENRWTLRSRSEWTLARGLWQKELDAKKIPYQGYMLE